MAASVPMPEMFGHLRFDAGAPFPLALKTIPGITVMVCALSPAQMMQVDDAVGSAPWLGQLLLNEINAEHIKEVAAAVKAANAAANSDPSTLSPASLVKLTTQGRARRLWALRQAHPDDADAVDARFKHEYRRALEVAARGLAGVEVWDGFDKAVGRPELVKLFINAAFNADEAGKAARRAFILEIAAAVDGAISALGKA